MSPRHLGALALSLGLVAVGARASEHVPPLPECAVAARLVPEDPLPERQTAWNRPGIVLTDVVYETLPGYRPLHLDLYQPAGSDLPRPMVVFLHGGAWAYANPRAGAAFRNFPMVLA